MSNSKSTCPVCNTEKTGESNACGKCGFEGAYYTLFSGEKAYQAWKSLVDAKREQYVSGYYKKNRENGSQLHVTGDRIGFLDAEQSKAVIVEFNNNEPLLLENVKQISLNKLYRVWLNTNGTVGSSGDGLAGQRRLGNLVEITYVATAPECTYAIHTDGTVTACGATALLDTISEWTDMKALCCAEHTDHVLGLKQDGTVLCAIQEGALFNAYAPALSTWKNVKKLATTDYYAVALCNDGSVLYTGADDEKSQCTRWTDMADIAADGQYVVGLTKDGNVLLAGSPTSPLLDFGRSEAANWKDMLFIAAGRSLIAGLSKSGELKIVGNILQNDSIAPNFKNAVETKLKK